jgi:hypothetical protein
MQRHHQTIRFPITEFHAPVPQAPPIPLALPRGLSTPAFRNVTVRNPSSVFKAMRDCCQLYLHVLKKKSFQYASLVSPATNRFRSGRDRATPWAAEQTSLSPIFPDGLSGSNVHLLLGAKAVNTAKRRHET